MPITGNLNSPRLHRFRSLVTQTDPYKQEFTDLYGGFSEDYHLRVSSEILRMILGAEESSEAEQKLDVGLIRSVFSIMNNEQY